MTKFHYSSNCLRAKRNVTLKGVPQVPVQTSQLSSLSNGLLMMDSGPIRNM